MDINLSDKMVQAMSRGPNGPKEITSEGFQDFLAPFISTPIKVREAWESFEDIPLEVKEKTGMLKIFDDNSEPNLS